MLLKFSLAFWAFNWVFQLAHFDSAIEAYAELAARAIPVCTSYTLATEWAWLSETFIRHVEKRDSAAFKVEESTKTYRLESTVKQGTV